MATFARSQKFLPFSDGVTTTCSAEETITSTAVNRSYRKTDSQRPQRAHETRSHFSPALTRATSQGDDKMQDAAAFNVVVTRRKIVR